MPSSTPSQSISTVYVCNIKKKFSDNKPSRQRRVRDWNEEERRRRKEKMRLDIEKENMKSLTSPITKSAASFKQISPDDRTAMNILDGTSPNKAKRLRPKTRRYVSFCLFICRSDEENISDRRGFEAPTKNSLQNVSKRRLL